MPQRAEPEMTKSATVVTSSGPAAGSLVTPAAPHAPSAASSTQLSLELSELPDRTGRELGLAVPLLLLQVRNSGRDPIDVPQPGTDLILSLRVGLKPLFGAGKVEQRYATLLRQYTVQLAPLPPGEPIRQGLSPLSLKRDDVPLAVGRYRVTVCIPPTTEAPYPSRFTDAYGGLCSNEIEIEAKKRR